MCTGMRRAVGFGRCFVLPLCTESSKVPGARASLPKESVGEILTDAVGTSLAPALPPCFFLVGGAGFLWAVVPAPALVDGAIVLWAGAAAVEPVLSRLLLCAGFWMEAAAAAAAVAICFLLLLLVVVVVVVWVSGGAGAAAGTPCESLLFGACVASCAFGSDVPPALTSAVGSIWFALLAPIMLMVLPAPM